MLFTSVMFDPSFFEFRLSNLVTVSVTMIGFILAYIKYNKDQANDVIDRQRARENMLVEQARMHSENASKLSVLVDFHRSQLSINQMRDKQLMELEKQTVKLVEIALAFNRRLEMIEDRNNNGHL